MTILTKDFAKIVVSSSKVSYGGNSATTSMLSETVTVLGGVQGVLPVIRGYPVTVSRTATRSITICTTAEVDALELKLFSGLNSVEAETALTQLLYDGDYGKPLHVYSGGNYIAAWYTSDHGLGFHYFIGYDYQDYPTQQISTEAIQRVA